MTNDDFKKMLDESLNPVNNKLDGLSEKVDELSKGQEELKSGYHELSKGQEELKGELVEVKNTIETRVLPPLVYIETTIKGYADSYKINDSNIRKMEKRLETLEEGADVKVPPEYQLEPLPEAA